MRTIIVLLFLLQVILPAIFAEEPSWERITTPVTDIQAVLTGPKIPDIIYIGAKNGIYKSQDSAKNWRMVLSFPSLAKGVNALCVGNGAKSIYAATGKGLYFSVNSGENWRRIFRGKNNLEEDCTAILVISDRIYLGTKGGLFLSSDDGRSWNRGPAQLDKKEVLAIARGQGDAVYVASLSGVFKCTIALDNWERILVMRKVEVADSDDSDVDDRDEELSTSDIRYLAVDAKDQGVLYVATTRGVQQTKDRGLTWQALTDYGLLNKDIEKLFVSPRGKLYAITPSGIFTYNGARWLEVSLGLAAKKIRDLSWDKYDNFCAASDCGLFRLSFTGYSSNSLFQNPSILCPEHEPSIHDIQEEAIKYAEVQPQKIISWRKKAAVRAWLPRLTAGANRNTTDLWHWEGGSTTKSDDDVLRRGRDSVAWDVSLSWDLSQLVWSDDQTNIDVRSRLMVQLRPLTVLILSLW
ncbi:MAG: hypothetical protein NT033_04140 [Candidatus Omnitrophica bacterium]|nr:hypothetical protein [Candidatus Omnitrophota bacterium]